MKVYDKKPLADIVRKLIDADNAVNALNPSAAVRTAFLGALAGDMIATVDDKPDAADPL